MHGTIYYSIRYVPYIQLYQLWIILTIDGDVLCVINEWVGMSNCGRIYYLVVCMTETSSTTAARCSGWLPRSRIVKARSIQIIHYKCMYYVRVYYLCASGLWQLDSGSHPTYVKDSNFTALVWMLSKVNIFNLTTYQLFLWQNSILI